MTLTKAAIADEIAFKTFRPKPDARQVTEVLLEIIKRTLSSGEDVMVSRFGKFAVKDKRERRGRNPATGEKMMLRSRRIIKFYPSKLLREKMNGSSGIVR